jgi:gamma-glutamylputrescine oxidase
MKPLPPQDQVFWYLHEPDIKPLTHDITADVVVVGGGMAGLSAAQSFHAQGLKVVLIEKNYCGAGASGKSSGFITPDSELPLAYFKKKYGVTEAQRIWRLVTSGVAFIKNNIKQYNIACDYQEQDTLVVATSQRAFQNNITAEHTTRLSMNYESTLYTPDALSHILGADGYYGGVSYGGTFGIQGYRYCYAMKRILQEQGVQVYEETPALEVQDHLVITPSARITAERIVMCTDRFTAASDTLKDKVYHAQTFLMLSAPLSDEQIRKIFPTRNFMIWDTDLVYHYFRITGDNRMMVGGSDLWYTYSSIEQHNNNYVARKLTHYIAQKFSHIPLHFEYIWPGMIGMSKDIFPLAGYDEKMPSVYYITAASGLPWAAALGVHSVARIVHNDTSFDDYLSLYRSTVLGSYAPFLLGTKLTFMLSNFLTIGSL